MIDKFSDYVLKQNRTGKILLIFILFFSGLALTQLTMLKTTANPIRDYGSLYGLIITLLVLFKFRHHLLVSYLTILIPSVIMWLFFHINISRGSIEGIFTMLFGMSFMLLATGYTLGFIAPNVLMLIHTMSILLALGKVNELELILIIMWFLSILVSVTCYHIDKVKQYSSYKSQNIVLKKNLNDINNTNKKLKYYLQRGIIMGYVSQIEKFNEYIFNLTVVSENNHFPVEATHTDIKGLEKNDLVIAAGIWETRWLDNAKTNQVFLVLEDLIILNQLSSHQGAEGDGPSLVNLLINSVVDVSPK